MSDTTPAPKPPRLRFHVWLTPADDLDAEPVYQGEVEVRNVDQLVAENQARSVGIANVKSSPFHLTNLWIHAACVRLGLTEDRFQTFTARLDYDAVKPPKGEPEPDPTKPHQEVN